MTVAPTAQILCIVFPILSIFAVIARFYARKVKRSKYAADDWMILPALLFAIANAVNVFYGVITVGLGQHQAQGNNRNLIKNQKITLSLMQYASEPIVTTAVVFARYSILLFYARIFTNRSFHIPVCFMYVLNLAWGISFTIAYLAQCNPLSDLWEKPTGQQNCIDISINYYYAITTIVLDVLVLCMPWPIVWRLQMPLRQKVAVMGIFMLGAIVVAVSIGKCYTFFSVGQLGSRNHDPLYNNAPLFYWTVPECCLSVVCACLPTLRPIFHDFSPEAVIGSIRSKLSLSSLRSAASNGFTGGKDFYSRNDVNKRSNEDTSGEFVKLARRSEEARIQGFENLHALPAARKPGLVNTVEWSREDVEMRAMDSEGGGEKGISVQRGFQVRGERA